LSIEDYAPRTAEMIETCKSHNGAQPGDPDKLAQALIAIIGQDEPPLRLVAGADAIDATEGKANELLARARLTRSRRQPHIRRHQRLNRRGYANAVREVLGVSEELKLLFGSSFGYADEAAASYSYAGGRAPSTECATFHE